MFVRFVFDGDPPTELRDHEVEDIGGYPLTNIRTFFGLTRAVRPLRKDGDSWICDLDGREVRVHDQLDVWEA